MGRIITDEMIIAKAKAVIRECDKHVIAKCSGKPEVLDAYSMVKAELYNVITVLENKNK